MSMPLEHHIENLITYTNLIEKASDLATRASENIHPAYQTFTYGYELGMQHALDLVIEQLRETLLQTGEITLKREEL